MDTVICPCFLGSRGVSVSVAESSFEYGTKRVITVEFPSCLELASADCRGTRTGPGGSITDVYPIDSIFSEKSSAGGKTVLECSTTLNGGVLDASGADRPWDTEVTMGESTFTWTTEELKLVFRIPGNGLLVCGGSLVRSGQALLRVS